MIIRTALLILYGLDMINSAYYLGQISKGEIVTRSRNYFVGNMIAGLLLIISIYFWWDA